MSPKDDIVPQKSLLKIKKGCTEKSDFPPIFIWLFAQKSTNRLILENQKFSVKNFGWAPHPILIRRRLWPFLAFSDWALSSFGQKTWILAILGVSDLCPKSGQKKGPFLITQKSTKTPSILIRLQITMFYMPNSI